MLRSSLLLIFIVFNLQLLIAQPPGSEQINRSREFFNSGVKHGINNEFEDAIKAFQKAIDINPLFAEAFLYKGLAEIELGDYHQAIKDFTITIELDPAFSDQAHYFRGLARYFLGEYTIAIEDFSIAIRMNPDFVAFYQRGKCNLKLKEYRRSLQDFDIAIRLKEDFHEAYLYRGISLYYLEEFEEAMEDLEKAKAFLPNNAEAHYYSGLVRLRIRNSYVAIEDLDRAIELNPQLSSAYEARADARQNTGNQQAARQDRQMAETLREQPQSVEAERTDSPQPVTETSQPSASTEINFAELFSSARNQEEKPAEKPEPVSSLTQTAPSRETAPAAAARSESRTKPQIDHLASGNYNINLEKQPARGFGVQVASYTNTSNLTSLANAYAEKYNRPVFINVSVVNGRTLYKLIIGQFDSRGPAEQFRDQLRAEAFPDSFLVVFENL